MLNRNEQAVRRFVFHDVAARTGFEDSLCVESFVVKGNGQEGEFGVQPLYDLNQVETAALL